MTASARASLRRRNDLGTRKATSPTAAQLNPFAAPTLGLGPIRPIPIRSFGMCWRATRDILTPNTALRRVLKLKHMAVGAFVLVLIGQCGYDSDVAPTVRDATQRSAVAEPSASPEVSRAERGEHDVSLHGSDESASAASNGQQEVGGGTAIEALSLLPVKGRAPMTSYERDRFGPAWLDADRNGCDTRNDMLAQYLQGVTLEDNDCVVATGAYDDPYTGARIDFWQGHGALIDIDHVVSMGNAWATGAFGWQIKKRAAFANDPLNLLPADAGANRQKGDGDAATWLPPNQSFRCSYVSRQVAVKSKYDLWVTAPEKAAIERLLTSCPDETLLADVWGASTVVDHNITDPTESGEDAGAESPSVTPVPGSSVLVGSVYFGNCDAVRAAGAAPIRLGDPGYGNHLDRDGDGTGCE